ncbi:MAG: hypothetical protein AAFP26_10170 [Planctomycetota bacterium]
MRLPHKKPYRAFPELDRFSDADCDRLVRIARQRQRLLSLAIMLGGAVLGIGLGAGIAAVLLSVLSRLSAGQTADFRDWLYALVMAAIIAGVIAMPCVGTLLGRDLWLRRALRVRIDVAQCVCGYSLLGLRPLASSEGSPEVTCPECGVTSVLDEHAAQDSDALAGRTSEGIGVRERKRAPWHRASITLGLVVGVVILLGVLGTLFAGVIPIIHDARAFVHNRVFVPVGLYLAVVLGYAGGFVPAWILNRTITRE